MSRRLVRGLSAQARSASGTGGIAAEALDRDDHFTSQKIAGPADVTFTQLLGINDHGLSRAITVGFYIDQPGAKHGFLKQVKAHPVTVTCWAPRSTSFWASTIRVRQPSTTGTPPATSMATFMRKTDPSWC